MSKNLRRTALKIIPHVPWGTHFCQFYRNKDDLVEILVPYFRAGLESNEYCMWITAEPLDKESAREAIRTAMPRFDRYLQKGQIEIIPHDRWYLRGGVFDLQTVLHDWIDKLQHALEQGYEGLRVAGNAAWLEGNDWESFTEYEAAVNRVIGGYRMIAVCSYHLGRCGAAALSDVLKSHQFALVRRPPEWAVVA